MALALGAAAPLLHAVDWTSTASLHTNLELIATFLALMVGMLVMLRYYSSRANKHLFVGVAFLGTAVFDAVHTVVSIPAVAATFPSQHVDLVPWSWTAPRLFLPLMLALGWWYDRREQRLGAPGRISERRVYALVAGTAIAVFALFVFVPLPPAHVREALFSRPVDLVTGLLLAGTVALYYRRGTDDVFDRWLVMSLVIGGAGQLLYMPFSEQVFDPAFDVSHVLKIASYVCVLIGLLYEVFTLYDRAVLKQGELEAYANARTRELQRSNKELDSFAYVASHDLKAPLRDVDNLSTWIQEDLGTALPADTARHLKTLRGRVQRMEGLLDDLLAYSRAGRVLEAAEQVDVGQALRDAAEVSGIPDGFVLRLPEDAPTVHTPRAPLETIFRNLIRNAVKHHDRADGTIRVSSKVIGDFVELSVQDDGPGIAPEFHQRVFQMFQQLKPRDDQDGTGIGLALVQRLVEAHGGAVGLESTPGQGCTFRFTWPTRWHAEGRDP